MDLFNVICTTCRASLKVRHVSAVGQILSCPRCGSMVEIVPPPGWQPPAASTGPVDAESDSPAEPTVPQSAVAVDPPSGHAESATLDHFLVGASPGRWLPPAGVLGLAALATAAVWMSIPGAAPVAHAPGGAPPPAAANEAGPLAPAEPSTPPSDPPVAPDQPPGEAAPGEDVSAEAESSDPVAIDPTATESDDPETAENETSPPEGPSAGSAPADETPWPEVESDPSVDGGTEPAAESDAHDPAAPAQSAETAPDTEAATDDAAAGADPAAAGPQTPPPLPAIDVAARWAEPLAGLEVREQPLVDFLALVSRVTTVPITLDLAGLRLAGISPATPVSFAGPTTTVGAAAETALAKLGLAVVPGSGDVWVTPQAFLDDQPREVIYPSTANLSPAGPEVAELVVTLVAPESWANQGGPGACQWTADGLAVTQVPRVQAEVARFWPALVAASAGPAPSGAAGSVGGDPPWIELAELMATPLTASFFRETPLVDVAAYLTRRTGWSWTINQRALAEAGLGAQVPMRLSANGEALAAVLEPALAPWKLALTAPAPGVVEITTSAGADQPTCEVYPLGGGPGGNAGEATAADIAERLEAHLATAAPELAGQITLRTLPSVAAVIVRAPAAGHRRVAEWWTQVLRPRSSEQVR